MLKHAIIISESACFPWGMAASSRVTSIAKALLDNHFLVEYIGLRGATTTNSRFKTRKGKIHGIIYDYPGGMAVRSRFWFLRRLDDILGLFLSLLKMIRLKIKKKIDVVIIYSSNFLIISFFCTLLHLIRIPVILEISEWPLIDKDSYVPIFNNSNFFFKYSINNVDAVLVISTFIEKHVNAIVNDDNFPLLKIPILIDEFTSSDTNKNTFSFQYLLYSGSIDYFEIALIVIDILHHLKQKGINLKLIFTGDGSINLFDKLKIYASKKKILSNLIFTGFVNNKQLIDLMQNALALLAPMPNNVRSESRFPTKLGYYLSSGTPVVTNPTGDIALYLEDNQNAFIVEKCIVELFADKIEMIIENPQFASKVGSAGKILAFNNFYYKNACRNIGKFLENVISKYHH